MGRVPRSSVADTLGTERSLGTSGTLGRRLPLYEPAVLRNQDTWGLENGSMPPDVGNVGDGSFKFKGFHLAHFLSLRAPPAGVCSSWTFLKS